MDLLLDDVEHSQDVVTAFTQYQRAQGKLPVDAFGDIEFETNRVQAEELAKEISFFTASALEDVEVNITIDVLGEGKPVQLLGWLTQNYQSGLVRYRSGKVRSQDYLSAWIDHLCLAVMGQSKTTHIIGYDKKEGVVHLTYAPLDKELATTQLNELVRLFYQGMTQPLAYFPKTALAGIEAGFSRAGTWADDQEKSLKKMMETFNDSYAFLGEGRDNYIARIWPEWNEELAAEVRLNSSLVLQAARLAAQNIADENG